MSSAKERLLDKTYEDMIQVALFNEAIEKIEPNISPSFMGYGTASDEKIFGAAGFRWMVERQRAEIGEFKPIINRFPVIRQEFSNGNAVAIVEEMEIIVAEGELDNRFLARLSTVLEYDSDHWMIVHFHGSTGDANTQTGEAWPIEEWKRRNAELQQLVDLKTAELSQKNRTLEIEKALEKVRVASMGMKKPADALDVCEMVFEELRLLGFASLRNVMINIYNDEKESFLNYDYSDAAGKTITPFLYHTNPIIRSQVQQLRSSTNAFYEIALTGKELKEFRKFRVANGEPDDPRFDTNGGVYYYFYSTGNAAIGISSFVPLSDEEKNIMHRFRNVFDFAYRRYNDVTKAEQQAREAKIELSLERVRARAMAMQNSDELGDLVQIVLHELTTLGFIADRCIISIFNPENNDSVWWIASDETNLRVEGKHVPFNDYVPYLHMLDDWKNRVKKAVRILEGDVKKEWDGYLFVQTDLSKLPAPMIAGMRAITKVFLNSSNNNFGCLMLATLEPISDEDFDILLRFARVFDLTYTRFNDLKQAEAQAREAKIELALERVRARAMAMHKSSELADLSFELVKQVQALGVATWHCAFNIYDEDQQGSTEWGSNAQGTHAMYKVPREGIFQRYYEIGQSGKTFHVEVIGEDRCAAHYEYLCSLAGVGDILRKVKDSGTPFPTSQIDHVAYFRYGYLIFITFEPAPEAHEIFKRFAKVFEQSYTRFLDLKKAEAQAREAQIEAALEKVRSRSLAMHSSDELREVTAVLFEKLSELGFYVGRAAVIILTFTEGSKDHTQWITDPTHNYPHPFFTPYSEHSILKDLLAAKDSGTDYFARLFPKAEKDEYFNFLFQQTDYLQLPEETKRIIFSAEHYGYSVAFAQHSGILIPTNTGRLLDPEEAEILKRFARVFGQSYIRFLDLKKAEAQAREAIIEASLERVRSRTMAMFKSIEVLEVAHAIYEELQQLGFNYGACTIVIMDKDSGDMEHWVAGFIRLRFPESLTVPFFDHPLNNAMLSGWRNGEKYASFEVTGDSLKTYCHTMFSRTGYKNIPEEEKARLIAADTAVFHMAYMSHGAIMWAPTVLTEEYALILQRFAKVFEQTYTRFLDLKKAEAQAREAKIETALERVRANALAMQQSKDLFHVATVLREQMAFLGQVDLESSVVHLYHDNLDYFEAWYAYCPPNHPSKELITGETQVPVNGSAWSREVIANYRTGKQEYTIVSSGDKLVEWYHVLEQVAPAVLDYDDDGRLLIPEILHYHFSRFSGGALLTISNQGPTDEVRDLQRRAAQVFDFAFTRFLDLQRAEAQAKEAQVEAALERVRSRSLAMHKSDEIEDVIMVVSKQLQDLQFKFHNVSFGLNNERQDFEFWMAAPGFPQPFWLRVPYINNPSLTLPIEARKNGLDFITGIISPEDNQEWLHHVLENSEIRNISDESKQFLLNTKSYARSMALNKHTILTVGNYAGKPYNNEQNAILKRFGNVFEQAYIRFLDLQKAEAQAREAVIEASLEKVRGKAMAMRTTNDLSDAAVLVFNELKKLGIMSLRCGVGLVNKESRKTNLYSVAATSGKEHLALIGEMKLEGHPVLSQIYESWQAHADYFPELEGESLRSYYEAVMSGFSTALPDTSTDKKEFGHFFPFSIGSMYAWTEKPFNENEIKVFKRFAGIIDLTFRRFNELQVSEANAREAVRSASLDRVRAEIASMRTSGDLDRITPLIWNELTVLGIPFMRCGVFIMDDSREMMHTFLSTPDGKALGAFHLPYDTPGNIGQVISHWRQKEIFTDHWTEAQFSEWTSTLVSRGLLRLEDRYLHSLPHDQLFHLYFVPFLQGMLYVGNSRVLSESELSLVQSVADSFSTAYARYEDFNRLELAKQQVDKTLTDLKQAQSQLIQSEKMASLGSLTAGIAHEIQNPLNFVNNFSEINKDLLLEMKEELAAGNIEEATRLAGDLILNEEKITLHGKRADAIVKGMLQHSGTSGGQAEPTDINSVADEYFRLAYHGIRAKDKSFHAELKSEFDPHIGRIRVVGQDIARVLLNLVNNAFYAVQDKQRRSNDKNDAVVTLKTKRSDDHISISVADNGDGISPKDLDKIFQPFFTTKPTGQGTGLGLSLSYDIVKAHGGEITVNNTPGAGAEFIVSLPISH